MAEESNHTSQIGHEDGISRRAFLRKVALAGTALGGAGTVTAWAPLNAPPNGVEPAMGYGHGPGWSKVPKAVALYRDYPRRGQHCAECVFFQPPHRCRIVAGPISPYGWSRYWTPYF